MPKTVAARWAALYPMVPAGNRVRQSILRLCGEACLPSLGCCSRVLRQLLPLLRQPLLERQIPATEGHRFIWPSCILPGWSISALTSDRLPGDPIDVRAPVDAAPHQNRVHRRCRRAELAADLHRWSNRAEEGRQLPSPSSRAPCRGSSTTTSTLPHRGVGGSSRGAPASTSVSTYSCAS